MKRTILITTLFSLISVLAMAQDRMPRVDDRQAAQRLRIHRGLERDEITRREAAGLIHDQRMIRRSERLAEADGDVTRYERRRLHYQQERASRRIHRARTNRAGV